MKPIHTFLRYARGLLLAGIVGVSSVPSWADSISLAQTPILALKSAPGLVMLTMSRDHRLFYAAYNDTSDLDGDAVPDVGYKPTITYYGNFVSNRCYDYITSGTNSPLFRPVTVLAATTDGCKVGATQRWHGNWLNWATTSRMDALRRVLYGGYRVVDNATTNATTKTSTVLQGAYIPKDSHVWGKEYRPTRDSYDITQYTTWPTPASGRNHVFVVVSPTTNTGYPFLSATVAPVLRFINDTTDSERIWLWASADVAQGIGSSPANFSKGGGRSNLTATDRTLRVEACVPLGTSSVREPGCVGYPLNAASPVTYKPTGILHDYARNDALKFGLLTGSYQKNYSGGVVRRNIGSFNDEIVTATGQFNSNNEGIARQIDRITIHGWGGSQYDCGYETTRNRYEGACKSWGAPIGEMMYEGLRYFTGKTSGMSIFTNGVSTGSADATIGFPALPAWQNPYRPKASGGSPICSKPVQMVIADPLTSFDSDQLPGVSSSFTSNTNFGAAIGTSNDLTGLNVSTEVNAIWTAENLGSRSVFIGQVGATYDGNPTAKAATGLSNLRGHAPDETQSQGTYYSAGVARFGQVTGLPLGPTGAQETGRKVDTIAVALGSLTPKIEFNNPSGGKVTIVPLAKAIYTANKDPGQYQATSAITGFYYSDVTATSVTAVVNFSDSDQGTDNETDAQAQYTVSISGSTVTVAMKQLDPYPGGIQSNMGYVISGTTRDGLYLEQRSNTTGSGNPAAGTVYYLDTLAGQNPKNASSTLNPSPLPTWGTAAPYNAATATVTSRSFTLSTTTSSVGIPQDALWYAAKYGGPGVLDSNSNPTNYFKITNPAELPAQMGKAFRAAAALAAVASTSVVGVGQRSLGTAAIYQASYDSLTWSSRLYAFPVSSANGVASDTPVWEASSKIGVPTTRNLYLGRGGTNTPVQLLPANWASLSAAEQADFGDDANRFAYILGDKTREERKTGGTYRNRGTTAGADYGSVLGDIVNSDPQIITKRDYGYAASDADYGTYLAGLNFETLVVGANDGFLHVFDADPSATGGAELFGFMPQAARTSISDLSSPGYQHRFTVDGAIGLGHAKIAVPDDSTAAWRTVAIGAGGAGAKTVFAINASSKTFDANKVLWEINPSTLSSSTTDLAAFGNVVGRPAIGKLEDGTWVAVFGNGYNSPSDTAKLFVVNLQTGAIIKVLDTNNTITGNGMGYIELVRKTTGNQDTIQYVYGSDYKGNIWRFDLSTTSTTCAVPATGGAWCSGAWVFQPPTGRYITAELKIGASPTGAPAGKMVYFGTGRYLDASDVNDTTVQALYGVLDELTHKLSSTAAISGDTSLSSMTITLTGGVSDRRTVSTPTTAWWLITGKKGWVVPLTGTGLTAGERVIAPPVRYTQTGVLDALLFTSIVPSTDECSAGLDTWVTAIDASTGGASKAFQSVAENSLKIPGGSPRGVFVLSETKAPTLYISQTVFNVSSPPTTSYSTIAGGTQTVTINGVPGQTRVLGINLTPGISAIPTLTRQIWRQLK